jgi:hypothetical protein
MAKTMPTVAVRKNVLSTGGTPFSNPARTMLGTKP